MEGKIVVVELQTRDQYGRAVGIVKVPYFWIFERGIAPGLLKSDWLLFIKALDRASVARRIIGSIV